MAPLLRGLSAGAAPRDGAVHLSLRPRPRALPGRPQLAFCSLRLVLQGLSRVSPGAFHRTSEVSPLVRQMDSRAGAREVEFARAVQGVAAAALGQSSRE